MILRDYVIGISGDAGSGKDTLAKCLSLAAACLRSGVTPGEEKGGQLEAWLGCVNVGRSRMDYYGHVPGSNCYTFGFSDVPKWIFEEENGLPYGTMSSPAKKRHRDRFVAFAEDVKRNKGGNHWIDSSAEYRQMNRLLTNSTVIVPDLRFRPELKWLKTAFAHPLDIEGVGRFVHVHVFREGTPPEPQVGDRIDLSEDVPDVTIHNRGDIVDLYRAAVRFWRKFG